MKKLLFVALGAAAVVYVVSRRRSHPVEAWENGSPLEVSEARRAVGEARERIEAEAENA